MGEEARCEEVCRALCEEQLCEASCEEQFCSSSDSLLAYIFFLLLALLILGAIVKILWPKATYQTSRPGQDYHSL